MLTPAQASDRVWKATKAPETPKCTRPYSQHQSHNSMSGAMPATMGGRKEPGFGICAARALNLSACNASQLSQLQFDTHGGACHKPTITAPLAPRRKQRSVRGKAPPAAGFCAHTDTVRRPGTSGQKRRSIPAATPCPWGAESSPPLCHRNKQRKAIRSLRSASEVVGSASQLSELPP